MILEISKARSFIAVPAADAFFMSGQRQLKLEAAKAQAVKPTKASDSENLCLGRENAKGACQVCQRVARNRTAAKGSRLQVLELFIALASVHVAAHLGESRAAALCFRNAVLGKRQTSCGLIQYPETLVSSPWRARPPSLQSTCSERQAKHCPRTPVSGAQLNQPRPFQTLRSTSWGWC